MSDTGTGNGKPQQPPPLDPTRPNQARKDSAHPGSASHAQSPQGSGLSRRGFLTLGTHLGAVAGGAAAGYYFGRKEQQAAALEVVTVDARQQTVAFDGVHQAGIATAPQAQLALVAFTVRAGVDREGVQRLLRLWTEDARRLCAGKAPLGALDSELAAHPANLTITCGFGPRLFDLIGATDARPEWLAPLPAFTRDQLNPDFGEADLVLQICSDDATAVAYAMRHMVRAGQDYVAVRWVQQGFLDIDPANQGETPRNLFGLKDGTVNPQFESAYDDIVWINEGPGWLLGGSAMVVRRIAMNLDTWDMLDRRSREEAFGRKLESGAPLTGEEERDAADFDALDANGLPVIDPNSHMARARPPAEDPNQAIRRRAYNYNLPPVPGSEQLSNAGLVFICYQKNPLNQFVPIQQRLDQADRINQWTTHIGSAVFACPPGTKDDSEFWGQALFQ